MDFKDLFIAPIFLLIIYGIAYSVRGQYTDKSTKKYFIPALTVKLIGAVALGMIYQFYYKGGDTFNFYTHVKIVYQAFMDSPALGLKLAFSNRTEDPSLSPYYSKMFWYYSSEEYFIIRIASLISFICFNSYVTIALFFALLSFSGMWAMFTTFLRLYPTLHKQFAIAIFFIPSVFFWGSGLMKDTIALGALGWLFHGFYMGLIQKKNILRSFLIIGLASYVISSVKIYILLSFLPPALFWIFNENSNKIKNKMLRSLSKPLFIIAGVAAATYGATNLTKGSEEYALDKIGERTKINADYIYRMSIKENGSAYSLGELDGTIGSMVKIAPQAVNVALFRPYLWEVKNIVMLLSALEASFFMYMTFTLFFIKIGFFKTFRFIGSKPIVLFCLIFSIVLAFAVGINSYNFGTLVRYKIPLMPFFLSALYIMHYYTTSKKKKQIMADKIRPGVYR